jgi:hypothetical protein
MQRSFRSAIVAAVAAIFATIGTAAITAMPVSAAAGATAAPDFAAHATAYQNAVVGDAMAAHPGGVRVSVGEVKWPGGVFLDAATSPTAVPVGYVCSILTFCGWTGADGAGTEGIINQESGWYPFGECSPNLYPGCNSGIHSWLNGTDDRLWLEQRKDGGNELCIDPHDAGNWGDQDYTGVDSSDYWWLASSNTANC